MRRPYYDLVKPGSWLNLIAKKQNLTLGYPATIDALETTAGWTVSSGTIAVDNVHKMEGFNSSLQMTAQLNTIQSITKSFNVDLSNYETFRLSVYTDNLDAGFLGVTVYFSQNNFTKFVAASVKPYKTGWSQLILPRTLFSNTGGFDWNVKPDYIRIRNSNSGTSVININALTGITSTLEPAVMLMFDDGYLNTYTKVFPILRAKNIPATLYAVTSFIGTESKVTLAQLDEMKSKGWTIANHTHTHANLSLLTSEEIEVELNTASDYLISNGFEDGARHVAFPWGQTNATVNAVLRANNYLSGRIVADGRFYVDDSLRWGNDLRGDNVETASYTLEQVKAKIDTAISEKKVIGLLFHTIVDTITNTGQWLTSDFQGLIDYIIEKKIQPITIAEAQTLKTQTGYVHRVHN